MTYNIYFSATDTTSLYANTIARTVSNHCENINWLDGASRKPLDLAKDDILVFSMPVYGGFIPALCAKAMEGLHGNGTKAIIAAVYGNRDFDDALVQMRDSLEKNGFSVIAAAALVAQHSIFPSVAAGRPDDGDLIEAKAFATEALKHLSSEGHISLPGREDYDPTVFKGTPFHPEGNEKCISCMACVRSCPVGAIDGSDPKATDATLCISCGKCIRVCPSGARGYWSEAYSEAAKGFEEKNGGRKENSFFYL